MESARELCRSLRKRGEWLRSRPCLNPRARRLRSHAVDDPDLFLDTLDAASNPAVAGASGSQKAEGDYAQPVKCRPLHSVEQLLAWRADEAPLASLTRAAVPWSFDADSGTLPSRQRLLFCHDMAGGYHEDAFAQGCSASDAYSFSFWQCVDVFVYFSHALVTVPPVGWISAAHRNGVPVLGTFITEWDEGFHKCIRLFSDRQMALDAASQLASIARWFGFDGWLVNIENKLEAHQVVHLNLFLRTLKALLNPPGSAVTPAIVLWYDAVDVAGRLRHQCTLNAANLAFFQASSGIFVDYHWDKPAAAEAVAAAHDARSRLPTLEHSAADVWMGVDCFGRGTFGGGRWHTDTGVSAARAAGASVALFAAAWPFESGGPGWRADNCRFWELVHRSWEYVRVSAASLPLVSSFCPASGEQYSQAGAPASTAAWFNLSLQDPQPLWLSNTPRAAAASHGSREPRLSIAPCSLPERVFHGAASLELLATLPCGCLAAATLFRTQVLIDADSLFVSYALAPPTTPAAADAPDAPSAASAGDERPPPGAGSAGQSGREWEGVAAALAVECAPVGSAARASLLQGGVGGVVFVLVPRGPAADGLHDGLEELRRRRPEVAVVAVAAAEAAEPSTELAPAPPWRLHTFLLRPSSLLASAGVPATAAPLSIKQVTAFLARPLTAAPVAGPSPNRACTNNCANGADGPSAGLAGPVSAGSAAAWAPVSAHVGHVCIARRRHAVQQVVAVQLDGPWREAATSADASENALAGAWLCSFLLEWSLLGSRDSLPPLRFAIWFSLAPAVACARAATGAAGGGDAPPVRADTHQPCRLHAAAAAPLPRTQSSGAESGGEHAPRTDSTEGAGEAGTTAAEAGAEGGGAGLPEAGAVEAHVGGWVGDTSDASAHLKGDVCGTASQPSKGVEDCAQWRCLGVTDRPLWHVPQLSVPATARWLRLKVQQQHWHGGWEVLHACRGLQVTL